MKKTFALLLVIVLAVTLLGCGENNGESVSNQNAISLSDGQAAVQSTNKDAKFKDQGNGSYVATSKASGEESEIEITVDENDNVLSIQIVNHNSYHKALNSSSDISDLMKRINGGKGDYTLGELIAGQSIAQVISFIYLVGKNTLEEGDSAELLLKAFSGGCTVNGWRISVTNDSNSKDVTVKLTKN